MRDGVSFFLETKITSVRKQGKDKVLALEHKGTKSELVVDEILVAVGRKPNVESLGLEKAGIAFDLLKGVTVNDRLQTSNRRVFAAGDVCSAYQFTHAADAMARIVIANALFLGRQKFSSLSSPDAPIRTRKLAQVGLTEQQARSRSIDLLTLTVPLSSVDRAVLDNADDRLRTGPSQEGF